jgi:hypothetical protein
VALTKILNINIVPAVMASLKAKNIVIQIFNKELFELLPTLFMPVAE